MKVVDTDTSEGFKQVYEFEDQSASFAQGFEVGTVFVRLRQGVTGSEQEPLYLNADIVTTYAGLANAMGYEFHHKSSEPGWIAAWFVRKKFVPRVVNSSVQ